MPDSSSLPLVHRMQPLLATERIGRAVRAYESVGSTNTAAAAWAREGAAEGSVVVAEYQTRGRGRQGRTWTAAAGQNLTFSLVLRPAEASLVGLIPLAASLAVADSIDAFVSPHTAAIKWPNDVLLDGRKCCGMLLESTRRSGTRAPDAVILGTGCNVNQIDFPPGLSTGATSLRLVTGQLIPRAELLARMLNTIEQRYQSLTADGGASVRRAYTQRLYNVNETATLRFTGTDRTLSGTVRGIAPDGGLRLDTPSGPRVVHSGEVTSQPAAP